MATTLCASGAMIRKAGANATTALLEADYTAYINDAEAEICANSRYDFVANYTNVTTIGKALLTRICSSLSAMGMIAYDPSGYTDGAEVELLLDVQRDAVSTGLAKLKDQKYVKYLKVA